VMTTVSQHKMARLWDALTGQPVGEAMTHGNAVLSAQFSPDGQRVVTASRDETARLWDATSGKAIGEAMTHGNAVLSAQFSPDGQRVVTASWDGTARLWDMPTIGSRDTADTPEVVLILADLAEASAGASLQISGQAEVLNVLSTEQVREILKKIAAGFPGAPSTWTPLQRFLKWSVSERRSRTISPFSDLTVAEWIENRIHEKRSVVGLRDPIGTLDGLRAAMYVDPANARLAAHFGRRLADYALKKTTDLIEIRREREEADFQTRRALKLAPDNDEIKKLRAEVVKLLQLPE
jgi:dipeptidyl aminopeptidase/acylaminoacyl peptidase